MFSLTYGASPAVYYYYYYQQSIHFLTLHLKSTQHLQYTHMAIPEFGICPYHNTRIWHMAIPEYQNLAYGHTRIRHQKLQICSLFRCSVHQLNRFMNDISRVLLLLYGSLKRQVWPLLVKTLFYVKFRELLVVWVVCVMYCVNKTFVVERFVHECFAVEPS